jgi:hypothetical protein
MMHEWHPADEAGKSGEEQNREDTFERQLKFYYGSELLEQPLPESSWEQVLSQLASRQRHSSRSRSQRHWRPVRPRMRKTQYAFSLHSEAQDAFTRVLFDAHMPHSKRLLVCRFTTHAQMPHVHVSRLSRQPLRLISPIHADLKPVELDVLLASGLARYEEMRRPTFILIYTLLIGTIAGLLVWTTFGFFWQDLSLFTRILNISAGIAFIGIAIWLLHIQARKLAQRADVIMVRWIGRSRACQGLHALADRSRIPSRRKLGELSLTERIARVCGTSVPIGEEHFTLVR